MTEKIKKKRTTKKNALETLSQNSSKKNIIVEEKEINVDSIVQEEYFQIEAEKENIQKYTDIELAEWIIDKFDAMSEIINYTVEQDFLNGDNIQARFYKLYFATELWRLLEQYNIEITTGTRDYLASKQEAEILDMLSFLNFI